jgi:hypothetical protein
MAEGKLSPYLQTALEAIDHATNGMTSEQMTWHPAEKWSAAEILEHLSLAYARTVERMKSALQEGPAEVRRRTFREWAGGVIVLKLGRIPPGRKAPEGLSPCGILPDQAGGIFLSTPFLALSPPVSGAGSTAFTRCTTCARSTRCERA